MVRLPRISNFTDADALAAEPGVLVRFADSPAELADADLVVLPGSRATVADLAWLRERGLAERDRRPGRAPGGRCWASAAATRCWPTRSTTRWNRAWAWSTGSGCCRCGSGSGRASGSAAPRAARSARPVTGYEIHHGIAEVTDPAAEPFLDGCRRGAVWGTSWHGVLENDEFRRAFLAEVAAQAGRDFTPAPGTDFAALRQARLDVARRPGGRSHGHRRAEPADRGRAAHRPARTRGLAQP